MIPPSSTIRDRTLRCIELFHRCATHSTLEKLEWIEAGQGDFNLWAHELSACSNGKASLDYRVGSREDVLNLISSLLDGLAESLEFGLEQASTLSGSRLITADLPVIEHAIFEDLEFDVRTILRQLSKIHTAIRRAGNKLRFGKADASLQDALNTTEFQIWDKSMRDFISLGLGDLDRLTMVKSGSELQARPLDSIQECMIHANLLRRHRIQYAIKDHEEKTTQRPAQTRLVLTPAQQPVERPDNPMEKDNYAQSGIDTSRSAGPSLYMTNTETEDHSRSERTATDLTSTFQIDTMLPQKPHTVITRATLTGRNQDYPSWPKSSIRIGRSCPYCAEPLSAEHIANNDRWRGHLTRDLLPYTCFVAGCNVLEDMFATSEDLTKHVQDSHGVLRWICEYCEDIVRVFETSRDWQLHVQHHFPKMSPSSLKPLSETSKRLMIEPAKCPICDFRTTEVSLSIDEHIIRHIHEFAIRSLPWGVGSEDGGDDDANSVQLSSEQSLNDLQQGNNNWPTCLHDTYDYFSLLDDSKLTPNMVASQLQSIISDHLSLDRSSQDIGLIIRTLQEVAADIQNNAMAERITFKILRTCCTLFQFVEAQISSNDLITYELQSSLQEEVQQIRREQLKSLEKSSAEELDNLHASIQRLEVAPYLITDHPSRVNQPYDLGIRYLDRFGWIGTLAGLEHSIQRLEEALYLTTDHSSRASQLYDLGIRYLDGYVWNGTRTYLERSIELLQEAYDLTPDSHPNRADRLDSLAEGYENRYQETGAFDDLEHSTELLQEAYDLTPDSHPNRVDRLNNLARGYEVRYQYTGQIPDLELSVQRLQEVLNLTPYNHPNRAHRLHNIGARHLDLYRKTEAIESLENAIQQFQEALIHLPSHPSDRLRAGQALFIEYTSAQNWLSAYETASFMMPLFFLLILQSKEYSDTQHLVSKIAGLASDAAVVTLKAEKQPYEALRLVELGCNIATGSLNDFDTDLRDLKNKHPHLAEQFSKLRALRDGPKEGSHNTGKQLERLIEEIRSLPGFEHFLLAPSEGSLKEAAIQGPIVVINVSEYGCHAFIIEQTGLCAVELPLLHIKDVQTQAKTSVTPDIEMLEWLWDTIASPVLDVLGLVEIPKHSWPRTWWIPTGALAEFPIHAAGCYSNSEIYGTVMDRTISSYSSSIRMIIDSRQNISVPTSSSSHESMVLVGMAQTPRYSSLPYVGEQIEMLAALGPSMQLEVKRSISRQEILSTIDSCKIFHFAGYTRNNSSDPLQSNLILSDGGLTTKDIFDANLHHSKPFLAYLSTCVSVPLIIAYQLAGFQHVISALSGISDKLSADVARDTYEWIKEQDSSNDSVSEGLHHACRKLRSQWIRKMSVREKGNLRDSDSDSVDDLPLHWVPYAHYGI